jgi:hypothetical protein
LLDLTAPSFRLAAQASIELLLITRCVMLLFARSELFFTSL